MTEAFAQLYSYKVPADAVDQYLDLQQRVSRFYVEFGCKDYLLVKHDKGDMWTEICVFRDREAFAAVEQSLENDPRMAQLFGEFQRTTGNNPDDLHAIEGACISLSPSAR